MASFSDFNLNKQLQYGLEDLGFDQATPIQEQAFSVVLSGKDMVGIAQTGTGKTLAYVLPLLQDIKFSKQINPRVLILVPTRELVLQVVSNITDAAKYVNVRVKGVYGGANINTQKADVAEGCDILVATPGRLYDLALSRGVSLKAIKKLVIDEVDVMLDLGFRPQLTNIFELLQERRQNIMFSATMTEEVDALIDDFFITPVKISIAVSGTPLDNIEQTGFLVENFYTKVNLLAHLLKDKETFSKVLVFVSSKRNADRLFDRLLEQHGLETSIIHSNKTQNYRIRSIEDFDAGVHRVLISTDVMARGLDLDQISHVINFDTPIYPENYMHRIGRTGRASHHGHTILMYTEKEREFKEAIEDLMDYSIPMLAFPEEVEVEEQLLPEEREKQGREKNFNRNLKEVERGDAFHEKSDKNKKTNQGSSKKIKYAKKYKKPKSRGDKNYNRRNKR